MYIKKKLDEEADVSLGTPFAPHMRTVVCANHPLNFTVESINNAYVLKFFEHITSTLH